MCCYSCLCEIRVRNRVQREREEEVVASVVTAACGEDCEHEVVASVNSLFVHSNIVIVCSLWAAVVFPLVWVFHVNIMCTFSLLCVVFSFPVFCV